MQISCVPRERSPVVSAGDGGRKSELASLLLSWDRVVPANVFIK